MWTIMCRLSGALVVSLMLVLGVVAVAGAQELRPFEEIQAGPIAMTPDETGRFATLTVDTTIDVACSVVYGTDESFGLIAVDDDMDGGAHANHHPSLGGLEPDTDYLYRLQGTAADGTLYVSETFSFSTPAEISGGPVNLALGATVVEVSSEFSDAFAGVKAIDGDPTTEWSSKDDGDDASITLDLGAVYDIGGLTFDTRSMSDGSSVTETFTVSADGTDHGPFPAGETVDVDITARLLRFDVTTSTGGNTGAIEIEVLAAAE